MTLTSEYLSASAGSGKTYALSKRFCHLVMSRVAPDSICALTFTRAATREIFAAIVQRLIDDKDVIEALPDGLTREEALARILEVLPRLQISTIDAFSAKVARLFAYDLEFDPDFALYDGGSKSFEAKQLLEESVRRALCHVDAYAKEEFLNRYDVQYDDNASSKSLSERLIQFFGDFESILARYPKGWGDLNALGCGDIHRSKQIKALCQALKDTIDETCSIKPFQERQRTYLQKFADLCLLEVASIRELKKLKVLNDSDIEKLYACVSSGVLNYYTKVELPKSVWQGLEAVWDELLARDLQQTAYHTQSLYQALVALQLAKRELTEEKGLISFDDLTRTLAEKVGGKLSIRDVNRFYVVYRLDAAIRHLMIDEFQDTSTEQWNVLSGIAHELASEEDGSFFYVGDVKQSIYGWRGGDSTLFGDETRLPAIPEGTPLLVSYRSCSVVINLINRLMRLEVSCGGDGKMMESWQRRPVEAWRKNWKDHHPAERRAKQDGLAQMWVLPALGKGKRTSNGLGNTANLQYEVARIVAKRWRQLAGKSVSIAVLARSNTFFQDDQGNGVLYYLRAEGVPCALEGRLKVADTPMGALIALLLCWLADPSATLWYRIAVALELISADRHDVLHTWITMIYTHGFVAWLDHLFGVKSAWHRRLSDSDRRTIEAIREGFEQLDKQGCVEPLKAYEAIAALEISSIAAKNVVNLMTIHKSKGLTFGVVFTILNDEIVREQRQQYEADDTWVLEKPALKKTYDAVPALKEAKEHRNERQMRDTLCALYVSITRAEREQIIIAPEASAKSLKHGAGWLFANDFNLEEPEPKLSKNINYSLVMMPAVHKAFTRGQANSPDDPTLQCVFEEGNPDWWQTLESVSKDVSKQEVESFDWVRETCTDRIEVALPSERAKAQTVAEMLRETATDARDFGIALHERLAQIEWTDEPVEGVPAEVFRKPDELCDVWRERPFSVQLDSEHGFRYVAGQFDRVHIFPKSCRAVIYDFKTSFKAEITPAYERQMKDYRTALSILLGYAPDAIQMRLVFTRHRCVMEVMP